ncbi:MAG: serine hydrolase domain-containing protein, partial [Bacteroidota bacterium]
MKSLLVYSGMFLFLLSACTNSSADQAKALEVLLEDRGLSGSMVVLQGGEVIAETNRGWADQAASIPFTSSTPSNLGPLSEGFTGALIALLQEEKKLELTDPLKKHIPSFPDRCSSNWLMV